MQFAKRILLFLTLNIIVGHELFLFFWRFFHVQPYLNEYGLSIP